MSSRRCVNTEDKATSVGLTSAVVSIFAVVPSPIIFGIIIDSCCLFWGKTCSQNGNCWLYDTDAMRYIRDFSLKLIIIKCKSINLRYSLNLTAACFVAIGTLFDIGTWYYSENVKIFDEKEDENRK